MNRRFAVTALLVTLGVAIGVSQLASDAPDGLEFVAGQEGFAGTARDHALADTPLADYGDDLTGHTALDTAIAGLVGVSATIGVGWLLLGGRRPSSASREG